jgi:hypothetical protein
MEMSVSFVTFGYQTFLLTIFSGDCNPRLPANNFQVKKAGPNRGKWFYTCQKPLDQKRERCKFFMWAEDAEKREKVAVMNNARTEPRPNINDVDNRYNTESGPADHSLPPPYSSPLGHQELTATVSRKRNANEFDDTDDWPLNAEEEHRAEAEAIEATTPRKAIKTEQFTTPGTHRVLEYGKIGLPTPKTDGHTSHRNLFGTTDDALTRERQADSEFLDLVSPASTPTPVRFRDAEGGRPDGELYKDIALALERNNFHLNDEIASTIKQVCARHDLKGQGIAKGYISHSSL